MVHWFQASAWYALHATAIICAIAVSFIFYYRFCHGLRRFSGPFYASFTNLWKAYHTYRGDFEHVLLDCHRKYGKVVRVGPNHLNISDAQAVKVIYGTGRAFSKSNYYDAFTALRPNLFGVRDEEIHSARRKACSGSFSMQSVTAMEPFIDGCLKQLLSRLDEAATAREVIDLKRWIAFFVLDVLGELAFSTSFGILQSGRESDMPPIREHVLLASVSGTMPWLIPYINKFVPKIPIRSLQRMIRGRSQLRQLAIKSVNQRIVNQSDRKDLLGRLLDELEAGVDSKGNKFELQDIQTEAFGFIVAGSHTTAATTTLLMWHLLHTDAAYATLVQELDSKTANNHSDFSYPYSSFVDLHYLQAAVTENFRISPVFTMPLPRVVPVEGRTIADSFIPGGTDVSICNHALHHDPKVFGEDLETFKPERWLEHSYNKSQYLMPFGAGHRACIGRNIATMEIYKMVGSILSRYNVELVHRGSSACSMPNTTSFGVADLDGGLLVRLEKRV
ncbi:cytochrome P450 [Paraphoma chrysanthemicola]|nr:cytochrome P450 [Paraphoma chrysanthemicola]